jgi:CheY-like chemotaxis protein
MNKSAPPLVLVVDDNALNRDLAVRMLHMFGYGTLIATDGVEAVARYGSTPDLAAILMDLNMPNMNGLEATRAIRRMEQAEHKKRVPVITWTASAGFATEADCRAAGMDDYLPKPTDLNTIRAALNRVAPVA